MDMTHESHQKEKLSIPDGIIFKPEPFASSDLSFGVDIFSSDSLHRNNIVLRKKVVLVGDATVGKTALTKAFISRGKIYKKDYLMTAGVDFNTVEVPISGTNTIVDLFIYDMGGQSIFNQKEMQKKYWDNCNFMMCVFDVSSRKSLQNCRTWIESVRSVQQIDDKLTILLVGNKIDLREKDIDSIEGVDTEEGNHYAHNYQIDAYFECSAKKMINVDAPFEFIASQIAQKYRSKR